MSDFTTMKQALDASQAINNRLLRELAEVKAELGAFKRDSLQGRETTRGAVFHSVEVWPTRRRHRLSTASRSDTGNMCRRLHRSARRH